MQVDLPLAVPRLGVVHLSPPSLLADVDARAVRRNVWDLDTESFSEAQPRRCAEYEEHAVLVPQFASHEQGHQTQRGREMRIEGRAPHALDTQRSGVVALRRSCQYRDPTRVGGQPAPSRWPEWMAGMK